MDEDSKPRPARRWAWAAAAALAAALALAWAFAPSPVAVEAAAVTTGRFERSVEEDGRTRLKERFTVSAPVAARLQRITLREGDRVRRGDVVAVLLPVMPSLVDERSRAELEARLEAARANLDGARARLARARVAQREAQLELERSEKLARDGFVAPSRLASVRLALDAARREIEAAEAAQDLAGHERDQAQVALRPADAGIVAGKPLALRAPVDGLVIRLAVQSEATVPAGAPLMDLGDTARMEVVSELLTTEAVQAAPGTRAVIERWGGPPVEGRLVRVDPGAFTKVSALGIEEQRVNAVIDLVDPPPAWRNVGDGFRVAVRLVTQAVDGATLVPVGALFPQGEGLAAYRIEGGRAHVQALQVGGRNGSVAWVKQGLAPGQQVVVYPPPGVRDGGRVSVTPP
ncbi:MULTISPECIES: HlyD family efflux transporter periplasmic adaptor subunit [Ramlibacter]|uniref:HlyD family efflux transporter periplasmic adaptor subunit n=1 Tax=Ramlibacter aquaticus TaxID=2780094 RepID=A0ABR9SCN2_9BURK|nr:MULTISPECIES: HlyD family efflux transporter periplasmic adaptor subunit [Ramlibacter]MBE7939604.1 HlyD family efflux transporter periplasmic adaptor subunit [Ramlibacter aquaticus]